MNRREFITLLGGAAAWPSVVRAQQTAMPVIGFLRSSTAAGSGRIVAAFRQGLSEGGYLDGQNVAIEFRWTEGQDNRLPDLATDLVRQQVTVIMASATNAAVAAKAATSIIPIVFVLAADPIHLGTRRKPEIVQAAMPPA